MVEPGQTKTTLYSPRFEHDACGIGAVVNLHGTQSHQTVDDALKIVEKLDSYGKEYLTRQAFAGEYVAFEELSEANGFTTLNIDKIEAVISYIAENV